MERVGRGKSPPGGPHQKEGLEKKNYLRVGKDVRKSIGLGIRYACGGGEVRRKIVVVRRRTA